MKQAPEVGTENWSRYNPLFTEKLLKRGFKGAISEESPSNSIWENGKDWSNPSAKEGGWIRVYPITTIKSPKSNVFETSFSETPRVIDKQIKNTVFCIQK